MTLVSAQPGPQALGLPDSNLHPLAQVPGQPQSPTLCSLRLCPHVCHLIHLIPGDSPTDLSSLTAALGVQTQPNRSW